MSTSHPEVLERSPLINGIDKDALAGTIDAIREDPSLALSTFRATNRWLAGNHNRTTVSSFFAAKQDIPHAQAFELDADEPPILAGNDLAPNPVEHLLHALASCLTTSMVAHAAVRAIPLRSVESEIEGDIDLNGYLGLSNDVPRGYTALRVRFKVDADEKYLNRLVHLAKFSPVFNTIVNGASVDVIVTQSG